MFWLQFVHLLLAAFATYYLVGKLKWTKKGDVAVRGIDGWTTSLVSFGLGTAFVWVLGWGAGFLGVASGLNWLIGGLACYAVCDFAHEVAKKKKG